jgi:hypothetical protein
MLQTHQENKMRAEAEMFAEADTSFLSSLWPPAGHDPTPCCHAWRDHVFSPRQENHPTTSPSANAATTHQMSFKNK